MSGNTSTIDDKLFTVHRKEYKCSHIRIKEPLCKNCLSNICTYICPAEVYQWDDIKRELSIRHENCMECGTCYVACEMQNIEWSNPVGGTGIEYRNS